MSAPWLLEALLAAGVILLIILYYYMTSTYSYWKDRNVPFAKPTVGLGLYYDIVFRNRAHADMMSDIYNQFKGERFCGFFQFRKPTLMVRDLNLVERILIKDFSHFEDRGFPMDAKHEPLSVNLIGLKGDQWRYLRQKLVPTFSSGKLKGMFDQIVNCGEYLLKDIEKYAKTGEKVDTKSMTWLFNTDVIASCAFGLQIKPDSQEGETFRDMVNRAIGTSGLGALRMFFKMFIPELAACLRLKFPPTDVSNYFISLTKATIGHRLKNNIKRRDFFQLLLSMKEREEKQIKELDPTEDLIEAEDVQLQYTEKPAPPDSSLKFTEEFLAAQTFVFLVGGSESIATSLSVVLHFLAQYPEVQQKLQAEIDSVLTKHNGEWTYQALKNMTYLDQVIQESQRMFTIGHVHMRICTTPYKIPDSDLIIEKGMVVVTPTRAIHMDPKYYPDPEVFNPDRFEGNNFRTSPLFTPFGDGPRMCIAMRFALLEMKIFVAQIMSKFSLKKSSKTLTPLRYDPRSFTNQPLGGIWISFQSRNS